MTPTIKKGDFVTIQTPRLSDVAKGKVIEILPDRLGPLYNVAFIPGSGTMQFYRDELTLVETTSELTKLIEQHNTNPNDFSLLADELPPSVAPIVEQDGDVAVQEEEKKPEPKINLTKEQLNEMLIHQYLAGYKDGYEKASEYFSELVAKYGWTFPKKP